MPSFSLAMKTIALVVASMSLVTLGCTSSEGSGAGSGGTSASGGAPGSGGVTGSGGATSSGGSTATGGVASASGGATSTGGLGSGGVTATGGVTSSGGGGSAHGGAASGGAAGGSNGGGGSASAGTGGAVGGSSGGGGSTGSTTPVPSPGCAKMTARPSNGAVTTADGHLYNFPTTYDGKTPMPMVMALHGANNPPTQLQGLSKGTRLETNFVRVFPKAAVAGGWTINGDASRLTTVFDDVTNNYCVDMSRIFLTGHSSGAQMAVQMLCVSGGEKRFKAVAPVAASKYCAKVAAIPVMYIQGMMDMMRGDKNGADVVAFFTSSNACMTASQPDTDVPTCKSALDQMTVTPGCVTYDGCTKPTIWCSHNDNSYNTTDGNMHGWPCFASNAMADFFLALP